MLSKKQNFKIALTLAGITLRDFARSFKVSDQAVDQTANGKGPSKRIDRSIQTFIRKEFKKAGFNLGTSARGAAKADGTPPINRVTPRVSSIK
jgi:transcriptional regulator with XRE-family HTH domain